MSPDHTYSAAGDYKVTLTVTDSAGSEGVVSKQVLVHLPPTADFTHTETGRDSSFNASSSTATGGATITGYQWDFGDGIQSTQAAPIHTFPADDTYNVSLTVTDSLGSTSTATIKPVTVKALDSFAVDTFNRTVGTGWGTADVGGTWTGTTGLSVAGGVGIASTPANASRVTTLPVSVGDALTTFSVGVDKAVTGGTAQAQYALHRSSAGEYRLKLRYLSGGAVSVWLVKVVGGTETLLVDAGNVSGYTQTAGSRLNVKVDSVTTGGSTTLRTKVWPTGTSEPSAWKATTTDGQAALQAAGQIAMLTYAPSTVTNGPLGFSFDDLNVSGKAGPHAAPVADFTHTESGLRSTFDSSKTTTSDNATITDYAWTFGDGSTSTQASPFHDYANPGNFDVTLKVTDSKGSVSDVVTKSVTVAAAPPALAADNFNRTVATGWSTADVGGAWTGTTGFSVDGAAGVASVPANSSRLTALPVSVGDAVSTFSVGVDKTVAGGTALAQYDVHRSSAGEYRLKLRYLSGGAVSVWLVKVVGTTETLLVDAGNVSGYTQTAGSRLNVKVDSATAGGSTTLRTKVWPAGTSEPSAWKATTTDSQAALQAAGQIALSAYAPSTVTNGPLGFSFDDLNVS